MLAGGKMGAETETGAMGESVVADGFVSYRWAFAFRTWHACDWPR